MKYKFKFRRIGSWFWTTKTVVGHSVDRDTDRLYLYSDGLNIYEVPKFSELEVKLGSDWKLAMKDTMEKEAGGTVNLKVN